MCSVVLVVRSTGGCKRVTLETPWAGWILQVSQGYLHSRNFIDWQNGYLEI